MRIYKPTQKQIGFAEKIVNAAGIEFPDYALESREKLSEWIDENKWRLPPPPEPPPEPPTTKQIAYAEILSEKHDEPIPDDALKSKKLISVWIDTITERKMFEKNRSRYEPKLFY